MKVYFSSQLFPLWRSAVILSLWMIWSVHIINFSLNLIRCLFHLLWLWFGDLFMRLTFCKRALCWIKVNMVNLSIGWIKVNIDSASSALGPCGCGVVFWNINGFSKEKLLKIRIFLYFICKNTISHEFLYNNNFYYFCNKK